MVFPPEIEAKKMIFVSKSYSMLLVRNNTDIENNLREYWKEFAGQLNFIQKKYRI